MVVVEVSNVGGVPQFNGKNPEAIDGDLIGEKRREIGRHS